ncbi:MAG: tail fiber protein [Thermoplasmata archaeon]|nr:MAG: tail fiber protein [Thermoplasmata archaeon]
MKKELTQTILLVCVLVLCLGIVLVVASDTDEDEKEEKEVHTHTHEEYVDKAGDTMTGDLVVENLHANEGIMGDGNGLRNLNASMINTGTINVARLPSNINADTLDGLHSSGFALVVHDHDGSYYTKTESDAKYALVSHSHPSTGDADTLDGYDSTYFANTTHTHPPGDAATLDGYDSGYFAIASHNHDSSYYLRTEVDSNFLGLSGGTLVGDLNLPNLYVSGVLSGDGSALTNLNASAITSGTIGIARLPPNINADTLDNYDSTDFVLTTDFSIHTGNQNAHHSKYTDADAVAACSGIFAQIAHTHNATHITEGELDEARLPQLSINDTQIETGFGLVPSGAIIMWNGTTIPDGWVLCNGSAGTPDLRSMFIVGYDPNDPDYSSIGFTGGEKSHLLLTNEMPAHTHSITGTTSMDGDHNHGYDDRYGTGTREITPAIGVFVRDDAYTTEPKTTNNAGDHSHTVTGSALTTGGSQAHENRPPYYVLAFIMKL